MELVLEGDRVVKFYEVHAICPYELLAEILEDRELR
jgi:hypothetical protein